ncbi:MAG: DUF4386 domain-containing protein [Candidatus Limnocylindrales bacterium]
MSRIGGWAGIGAAITYLVGFALAGTLLADTVGMAAVEYVAFLADNEAILYVWSTIIYVINGALLAALVVAVSSRLAPRTPDVARIAGAIGLIWAGLVIAAGMVRLTSLTAVVGLHASDPSAAASLWPALEAVQEGLGGGIEVPGGLWVLLVSIGGLRSAVLPRQLHYLGLGNGLAGILTIVPGVEIFAVVFGLGMLTWFAWVGIVLLRESRVAEPLRAPGTRPNAIARPVA